METNKQLDWAIYHSVHQYRYGAKGIAMAMSMKKQVLINKVNPHCNTHKVSAQEAARIMEITQDDRIAHAYALIGGGDFKKQDCQGQTTIFDSVMSVTSEVGDVSKAIQEAMKDGHISLREQDAINCEITQAIDELLKMRKAVNAKTESDCKY